MTPEESMEALRIEQEIARLERQLSRLESKGKPSIERVWKRDSSGKLQEQTNHFLGESKQRWSK
jgi:hypothetical protein